MPNKKIKLGLMIQGAGNVINAWRSPEVPADASVNFPFYVELVQKGRNPEHVQISPGIHPIVAVTDEEVENRYDEVKNLVNIENALAKLGRYFKYHHFMQYELDAPFPELHDLGQFKEKRYTKKLQTI